MGVSAGGGRSPLPQSHQLWRKIFENSDAKSCILTASALISGLPRTCISEQTAKKLGGPIHCWSPNLKVGGPAPCPHGTVVVPMPKLNTFLYCVVKLSVSKMTFEFEPLLW